MDPTAQKMMDAMQSGQSFDQFYGSGGVLSDIGDWFSGNRTAAENQWNMLYDQWQLDQARQYESSAYQRSVADLKAAGLNPWLALQKGVDVLGSNASGLSYKDSTERRNGQKNVNDFIKQVMTSAAKIGGAVAFAMLG